MGKDNQKSEVLVIKDVEESNLNLEKFDYGNIAENITKNKINAYIDDSNVIKEELHASIESIENTSNSAESANDSLEVDNKINPFAEIFDTENIVNRGKSSDYIVDDLLKRKQEQEKLEKSKQHFYISKAELDSILNDNPRMQMFKKNDNNEIEEINATSLVQALLSNLKSSNNNDMIELSIPVSPEPGSTTKQLPTTSPEITAGPAEDDGYIIPHAYSDDEEDTYYMSEEDAIAKLQKERMEMTLRSVQDVIDKLTEEEKYLPPDELFREFLQENFRDFLLAKKISGNSSVKYADKIVPKENIKNDKQTVEVSDLNKSQLVKAGERTSVLINRDEDLNIESIEILCKCGEKTLIRFAEQDEKMSDERTLNNSYTDVVLDTIEVAPINSDNAFEEEYANFDADLSDVELSEMQELGTGYD